MYQTQSTADSGGPVNGKRGISVRAGKEGMLVVERECRRGRCYGWRSNGRRSDG